MAAVDNFATNLFYFVPKVPVDVRLDKFKEKAVPLVSDVARRAIKEAGLNVEDISKLVVVSSTGFLGPGLDCELIKNLGLTRSVDRTLIGFMGCAAAMNGFRNANDYVTVSLFCGFRRFGYFVVPLFLSPAQPP